MSYPPSSECMLLILSIIEGVVCKAVITVIQKRFKAKQQVQQLQLIVTLLNLYYFHTVKALKFCRGMRREKIKWALL